jgi:hypothetical protein
MVSSAFCKEASNSRETLVSDPNDSRRDMRPRRVSVVDDCALALKRMG